MRDFSRFYVIHVITARGILNVEGQISEHTFAPSGGHCVCYPSNIQHAQIWKIGECHPDIPPVLAGAYLIMWRIYTNRARVKIFDGLLRWTLERSNDSRTARFWLVLKTMEIRTFQICSLPDRWSRGRKTWGTRLVLFHQAHKKWESYSNGFDEIIFVRRDFVHHIY